MPIFSILDFINFTKTINNSLHINELKDNFKGKETFTSADLLGFYSNIDSGITKTTLNWRIHNLVRQGHIKRLGRGIYALGATNSFVPEIDDTLKKINSVLVREFRYAKTCLWNTKVFNQWMLHQPSRFYVIVEVEKDAIESVFHKLQESFPDSFLQPSDETIQRYIVSKSEPLFVLPLISEAPTQEIPLPKGKKITTTTLEKLMVDIFCETEIYAAQQGRDMKFIYDNIMSSYTINVNKMLRYASRRKRRKP